MVLNAVCHDRFTAALAEAAAADAAIKAHNASLWFDAIKVRGREGSPRAPLPPFLGVPCRCVRGYVCIWAVGWQAGVVTHVSQRPTVFPASHHK